MISPTEKKVRGTDTWGSGAYGSPRGDHLHNGVDFIAIPGQIVIMPISGLIAREARPYSHSNYSGVLIRNNHIEIMMFYLELLPNIIGKWLEKGDPVGTAQDISKKYPGITNHIHLTIKQIDPELLLDIP